MAFIIKKKVSLDFLGEDYKDAELTFQSVPAKDIPEIVKKTEVAQDDATQLYPIFLDVIQTYFLEGKDGSNTITKEDIASLDQNSVITCFQIITGQTIDPKDSGQSTNISTTEVSEAPK